MFRKYKKKYDSKVQKSIKYKKSTKNRKVQKKQCNLKKAQKK